MSEIPAVDTELCRAAIDMYAKLLDQKRRGIDVDTDTLVRTVSATVLACDALAGYRKKKWDDRMHEELAARGFRLRALNEIERQHLRDIAYSGAPTYIECTTENAIRAYLPELTSEE